MVEDYEALKHQANVPIRKKLQRIHQINTHAPTGNHHNTRKSTTWKPTWQQEKRKQSLPKQQQKLTKQNQENKQHITHQTTQKKWAKRKKNNTHRAQHSITSGWQYNIYADDTNLRLHPQPTHQIITRLSHYNIIAQTRQLKINWGESATANATDKNKTTTGTHPSIRPNTNQQNRTRARKNSTRMDNINRLYNIDYKKPKKLGASQEKTIPKRDNPRKASHTTTECDNPISANLRVTNARTNNIARAGNREFCATLHPNNHQKQMNGRKMQKPSETQPNMINNCTI